MDISRIIEAIEKQEPKSQDHKARRLYALEMLAGLAENKGAVYQWDNLRQNVIDMLNGAENWQQYNDGGCSLVYNRDIAERIMTPSEFKRWENSTSEPDLLGRQYRYLLRAVSLIKFTYRCLKNEGGQL